MKVTRIDRLARSGIDLFTVVKRSIGRLMLAVLSGVAGVQHHLIGTRTTERRSKTTARPGGAAPNCCASLI